MHMRKLSFEGFLDLKQELMSTTQIFAIGLNCLGYTGMTSNSASQMAPAALIPFQQNQGIILDSTLRQLVHRLPCFI